MNINLETINWFGSVGNYTDGKDIGLPVKAVGTQGEMIQNLESIDWGNFILYAKNKLSWYIKTFHKEQAKGWNDIAREAQEWYGKSDALIAEAARERDIAPLTLPYCRAIWISYYLEQHYYNKAGIEVPMHFHKISAIFLAGHIPCGWEGPMPENRGYDAIDLNEGKILIW